MSDDSCPVCGALPLHGRPYCDCDNEDYGYRNGPYAGMSLREALEAQAREQAESAS